MIYLRMDVPHIYGLEKATPNFFPIFRPLGWESLRYEFQPNRQIELASAYIEFHETIAKGLNHLYSLYDLSSNGGHCSDEHDFDASAASIEYLVPNRVKATAADIRSIAIYWFIKNTTNCDDEQLRVMPYRDYLQTVHWRTVRYAVLLIYEAACQREGCRNRFMWDDLKNIHVHHLSYERRGGEQLYDLQLLCADCHAKEHGLETSHPQGDLGWLTIQQRRTYARRNQMGQGDEYLRDMWEIHEGRMTYSDLANKHQVRED